MKSKVKLEYLGGHPTLQKTGKGEVKLHRDGMELSFKGKKVVIPTEEVRSIIQPESSNVNAAGGAIAGALVAGPIGLLVGGLLGALPSLHQTSIVYEHLGITFQVVLRSDRESSYGELLSMVDHLQRQRQRRP